VINVGCSHQPAAFSHLDDVLAVWLRRNPAPSFYCRQLLKFIAAGMIRRRPSCTRTHSSPYDSRRDIHAGIGEAAAHICQLCRRHRLELVGRGRRRTRRYGTWVPPQHCNEQRDRGDAGPKCQPILLMNDTPWTSLIRLEVIANMSTTSSTCLLFCHSR
jgi:hypothetical protein